MLQPMVAMLAGCVLGIGFLIRFVVALAGEESQVRVVHQIRPRELHYATDGASEPARHRWAAVDSGAHIAMGVLRITTALASNPRRGVRQVAEGSNVVVFAGLEREGSSTVERRYRSS